MKATKQNVLNALETRAAIARGAKITSKALLANLEYIMALKQEAEGKLFVDKFLKSGR